MPTSPSLVRARVAVGALFLLHGLTYATWVARIPAVQADLRLTAGPLGLLLLCAAIGSMLSMMPTGWLIARHGSRPVTAVTSLVFCVALLGPGLAGSAGVLAAALLLFGATAGAMDVAMNAQAVTVERAYARPIMSSFHALFSVGGMAGAALGGAVAGFGVVPAVHFVVAGLVYLLATLPAIRPLLPASADAVSTGVRFRRTRQLAALGLLAACVLAGEGAMADWTGVYLRSVLGTPESTAALGYSVFSAAMAAGRFAGDRVTVTLGPAQAVRLGTLLGALGLTVALATERLTLVFVGLTTVGLGFSVVVPLVFGAAGRAEGVSPGTGLAAVTTAGYVAFLTAPPFIGGAAELVGLRAALGVLVLLSVAAALLARAVAPPTAERW